MKTILTIVLVGLLGAAGCAMFGGPRQSTPGAGTTASNEESPGSTAIAPGPVQQQGWVNVTYTSAKAGNIHAVGFQFLSLRINGKRERWGKGGGAVGEWIHNFDFLN